MKLRIALKIVLVAMMVFVLLVQAATEVDFVYTGF